MKANVFVRKYKIKNGETRYRLIVREFGKKEQYICLGPVSRKIAFQRRLKLLQEIQNGTFQIGPSTNLFFGEFLEKHFFPWAEGNKAPNTVQTYRDHLKHVKKLFRGFRLSQIQRQDIEKHLAEWKVSGRTKNVRLCIMRQVFIKAIDWKYLLKSPVEGIRRFSESSQGSRALTPKELSQIWDGLTRWQSSLIRVMVNSGLRPGEAANLKFQDIDWDQNRLVVANDKTRKTKNRKSRVLPMNPDIREELEFLTNYLPLQGYSVKTAEGKLGYLPREPHQRDYVFCNTDGSSVKSIRLSLIRAFKKRGLNGVTPHSLRKTFCTQLARQNVHPRVAQQLMGHSKVDLTMRVYTEVDDDQLRKAVNLLPSRDERKAPKLSVIQGGKKS